MFYFLFGWMVGSSERTARDAAVARKKTNRSSVGAVLGILVLVLLLIGPVLGPVMLTDEVTTTAGVWGTAPKLNCGSPISPLNPPKVISGSVVQGAIPTPQDWCSSKITGQLAWGIILTVLGLALWGVLVSAFVKFRRERAAL